MNFLCKVFLKRKRERNKISTGKITPLLVLALLALANLGTVPAHAAANVYYVAPNGSDKNPGTETAPWLTIQNAVNKMVAGDTVYVKSGTYNEQVAIVSRPSSMTIKAYPGNAPILDGGGLSTGTTGIITIRNTDYLTVDGFEIRNTTATTGGHGVYAYEDVDHLTLKNLRVHNINKGGMYFDGMYTQAGVSSATGTVTNLVVDSCEVYDTNRIFASNEQVSLIHVNGFEIKNGKFHDSGINGIDTQGKDGIDLKNGTNNGSIHDNEIYGSSYTYGNDSSGTSWNGIYIDGQGSAQDNFKIYNNYFHDFSRGAIVLGNEEGGQAITNVDIYNNIFYENQYAFRVYPHTFTRNYRFINNTCYKNYYTIASQATTGINSNVIIRNNILYGTSGEDYLIYIANYGVTGKPTIDHNIYFNPAGYQSDLAAITGGYTPRDPLFVSAPGDFKLQINSPAINAGSSANAPATDYMGTARPQGSTYDIGAYEMTSGSSAPPVPPATIPLAPGSNTLYASYLAAEQGTSLSTYAAQTFTPQTSHTVRQVTLDLYNSGAAGTVTVSIRATDSNGNPTSVDLATSAATSEANLGATWTVTNFDLGSGYSLQAGTRYAICVRSSATGLFSMVDTAGTYSGGSFKISNDGTSWTDRASWDIYFQDWGTPSFTNAPVAVPAVPTGGTTYPAPSGGGSFGGGFSGGGVALEPGVTNLSPYTNGAGLFNLAATIKSDDGKSVLNIAKGVNAQTKDGSGLTSIKIVPMATQPASTGQNTFIGLAYEITPEGATFLPAIALTLYYDPTKVPQNINMDSLTIAVFNPTSALWEPVQSVLNKADSSVTANIQHFSNYAIIGKPVVAVPPPTTAPAPAPASFSVSGLTVSPPTANPGQTMTISTKVSNTGGTGGEYEVTLKINGAVETSKKVSVDAGATEPVAFTVSKTAAGTYQLDVNGATASFNIVAIQPVTTTAPPQTQAPATPTTGQGPNRLLIGIIVGAVVVVAAVLGIIRMIRRAPLQEQEESL